MKINIKGKELELHYSLRILINYEEITGKSLDMTDFNSFSNLSKLFYAAVLASLQYNRMPLDVSWEDFLDFIDDNDGIKLMSEFGNWFANIMATNLKIEDNKKKKNTSKKSDSVLEKNV